MNIIHQNLDRYLIDHDFLRLIGGDDICVLSDFILNRANIDTFWQQYYSTTLPHTVICGLNPGRFGAGKTGIPFLDFLSLSQLIAGIHSADSEKSASFFFKVIQSYGVAAFFHEFYVTNIASVGFIRGGKNLNYHDLPDAALAVVERNFLAEMAIVKPTRVIALGIAVQRTTKKLLSAEVDCSLRLPHPAWVATYRGGELDRWVEKYVAMLKSVTAATTGPHVGTA